MELLGLTLGYTFKVHFHTDNIFLMCVVDLEVESFKSFL